MINKLKNNLRCGAWGIGLIVLTILILAICVAIGGAVIYWIGNFAFDVFNIDYQLTYVQGVATYLVLWLIKSFLGNSNK